VNAFRKLVLLFINECNSVNCRGIKAKLFTLAEDGYAMNLKSIIREFPDFPKKGVLFRDVSPVLKDPKAMQFVIEHFYTIYSGKNVDLVAGIESRGFIFACALAIRFGKGFVMIRKQGKLPGKTIALRYDIEYGSATMEIQHDAVSKGQNVLIADDLIATGGTAKAAAKLIERLGGNVVGFAFVVELAALNGRDLIKEYDIHSLVTYP
jgi:adenine phosphoribosyltransferase